MEQQISDVLIPISQKELDFIDSMFDFNEPIDWNSPERKKLEYELEVKWLREQYGENII